MEAEQTSPVTQSALAGWWDSATFEGKDYCRMDEDGSLLLRETPFSPGRSLGTLTTENAAAVIKALTDKFPEVESKVAELAEEWQNTPDKLKLAGKVSRLRDYLLHAAAIGNFEALYRQLDAWHSAIGVLVEENYAAKKALVEKAEALSAGDNWKDTTQALRDLAEEWKTIGYVDKGRSDELWNALEAARTRFFDRKREHQEVQEKEMLQNLDLKMELVEKAERLAASEAWKETTEVFKHLMDQWKSIGRTLNDKNEALWNRFITAKNVFYDRKKQHFESIQQEQEANYVKKMALVEQAEAMSDSTDWNVTANAYQKLMEEWKAIGRVPAEKSDELWDRLSKAKENFFGNKRHHFEAMRVSLEDNYAQKTALLKRAEELQHSSQWREATDEFKELMDEWKKTGPVPREHSDKIWEQFLAARRNFFERKDADRERRKQQAERQYASRFSQTRQFLDKLREELKEEEDRLADFRDAMGNLTTGPKEEELRQHLQKLISQTEPKVKRKQEKIGEVEQQLKELESGSRKSKKEEKEETETQQG